MIIIILILWTSYCLAEGVRDGFTFDKEGLSNDYDNNVLGYDIHFYFSLMRVVVITSLSLLVCQNVLEFFLYAVNLALMQPLLSNGMYFHTRNKEDERIYPSGFTTNIEHSTSTARINIDKFRTRLIMFILGLLSILIIQCYNIIF